jgi:hypothetical protein
MEQIRSCEADGISASPKLLCVLRNPNVHYRVHNSPPLILILSSLNPKRSPRPLSYHYCCYYYYYYYYYYYLLLLLLLL